MPQVTAEAWVPVPPGLAIAVSQPTVRCGPCFASFGGGWRFVPKTRHGGPAPGAVWTYTYAVQPAVLRPVAEPNGQWLLGREIRARIAAFARACEDPVVLDAV